MPPPEPYYQDDTCTIYHGDCAEILPILDKVDAIVTDPPYGINENPSKVASRGKLAKQREEADLKARAWHQFISGRLNQKLLTLVCKRRLKEIVRK